MLICLCLGAVQVDVGKPDVGIPRDRLGEFSPELISKRRQDEVSADAVYLVAGIDDQGYRDILGFYVGCQESANFWQEILADLKGEGGSL